MTSVAKVLAEHDLAASEEQVAQELRVLLAPARPAIRTAMSAADEAFLLEFGGVAAVTDAELADLDARSAARAVREVAEWLSRAEVAQLLGIDPSRVSHRVRHGDLLAFVGARGARRFPDWQFENGAVLPRLRAVLAAFPGGAHPVTLRSFMTTPDDSLRVGGRPVSPRAWLLAGGAPEPVSALAETLGEQV